MITKSYNLKNLANMISTINETSLLYVQGYSAKSIATKLNISICDVYKILTDNDIKLRKGNANDGIKIVRTKKEKKVKEELSEKELARKMYFSVEPDWSEIQDDERAELLRKQWLYLKENEEMQDEFFKLKESGDKEAQIEFNERLNELIGANDFKEDGQKFKEKEKENNRLSAFLRASRLKEEGKELSVDELEALDFYKERKVEDNTVELVAQNVKSQDTDENNEQFSEDVDEDL